MLNILCHEQVLFSNYNGAMLISQWRADKLFANAEDRGK